MKKIAIVGSKPDTWDKCAKLDRRAWDIWRFSRKNYEKEPKASLWFELHHPRNYERYESQKPGYTQFLKDNKAMLWEAFPFLELLEEFDPFFFHYGQAPWLIAYAITKKPEEIMLFGMEPGTEYGAQKKEIQHFMSVARDRGIKITAPEDPALNTFSPLYCIENDWVDQDKWLAHLRSKGLEPTTADKRQTSFGADQPRARAIEEVKNRHNARMQKYGKDPATLSGAIMGLGASLHLKTPVRR